jgi:hypothetical protein
MPVLRKPRKELADPRSAPSAARPGRCRNQFCAQRGGSEVEADGAVRGRDHLARPDPERVRVRIRRLRDHVMYAVSRVSGEGDDCPAPAGKAAKPAERNHHPAVSRVGESPVVALEGSSVIRAWIEVGRVGPRASVSNKCPAWRPHLGHLTPACERGEMVLSASVPRTSPTPRSGARCCERSCRG